MCSQVSASCTTFGGVIVFTTIRVRWTRELLTALLRNQATLGKMFPVMWPESPAVSAAGSGSLGDCRLSQLQEHEWVASIARLGQSRGLRSGTVLGALAGGVYSSE